eukprot:3744870-Lingulodinium_polyedra.AAC.1
MEKILGCLPRDDRRMAPEVSAQELRRLANSDVCKFAPRRLQEVLRHIEACVASLIESRPPDITAALSDSGIQPAIMAFQFFMVREPTPGTYVYGAEALKDLYVEVQAKIQKQVLSLDDLAPFKTYYWLVPDDIKQGLDAIFEKTKKDMPKKIQEGRAASSGSGTASSSRGKPLEADDGLKRALDMFRK